MKFSIITVVYNNSTTIESCIQSVQNQTYKNVEHIIIDGGSTDGTLDIIKTYDHIRWVSEPDQGIYDAMNKGIRKAKDKYVFFLNSGDVFANEFPNTICP